MFQDISIWVENFCCLYIWTTGQLAKMDLKGLTVFWVPGIKKKEWLWCWLVCFVEQTRGQCFSENNPQLVAPNADTVPILQITHPLSPANSELQGMPLSRSSISLLSTSPSEVNTTFLFAARDREEPMALISFYEFRILGCIMFFSPFALNSFLHFYVSLCKKTAGNFHLCLFFNGHRRLFFSLSASKT